MSRRPLNKRYRLMMRWGVPCVVAAGGLSYLVFLGGVREDPAAPNADGSIRGLTSVLSREITPDMVRFTFDDVTSEAGIVFRHFPAVRQSLLPEDMGSGVAWGDYDDDGDADLFLVNFSGSIAPDAPVTQDPGRCALYRNEGDGTFVNVAASAGVDGAIFGLGAAWGDFDNDDDLDLYVTAYGPNHLYRNNGDGTFTDIAPVAGVDDDEFGAGCVWTDFDADGLIDLYVCNYVQFVNLAADRTRKTRQYGSEIPYTINPSSYRPQVNRFYRNRGDGTFVDVAPDLGVDNPTGRSLGAVFFDFERDGLIDLYVANDVSSNGVFHNMGDGTFADIGASSLAADYRGAMGLAVGDIEHDGDHDLFVTHWISQENAFFQNMISEGWTDDEGKPVVRFLDNAEALGLGQISLRMVGWATGLPDFDNDGNLDLYIVNGNTLEMSDDNTQIKPQETQIFWHDPDEGFFEIAAQACPRLVEPMVGRGGAYADYDNDGRVDLALLPLGGAPILLRNTAPEDNHWLTLRLRQRGGNTRALGAQVTVRVGEARQYAQVGADGSYLSQNQLDLHFGLGDSGVIDELIIRWPDGVEERLEDVEVDRILPLTHDADYNGTRGPVSAGE